jgi:hypothetical protein
VSDPFEILYTAMVEPPVTLFTRRTKLCEAIGNDAGHDHDGDGPYDSA